ncbi:MAG: DNA repair protein RecO [Phycisphaerae bacterium]|jgi:DNA repair protein RecO (recombination protein O)
MLKKDFAVCIRAVDYSETSQVITFFTKDAGKFTAIAKGSKRSKSAFDGPIELFANGQIVFSQPHTDAMATLTEFSRQIDFSFPGRNLFALHCASLAAELLNSTTDDYDPHPQLFDAFLNFLAELDQSNNPLQLLIIFQLTLLKEIGLMPIFDHCSNCKTSVERRATSDKFFFSSEANGLVCGDCETSFPDKISVSKNVVEALYNYKNPASKNDKTLKEIEKVLISHFAYVTGRQPRMAKYVLD